jgi:hypothetical protein
MYAFILCIYLVVVEIISLISIKHIMTIICCQLHYRPADIPHSSLRTMARDVRRAMLPNNDEVLKKSFAEGIEIKHTFKKEHGMISCNVFSRFGWKSSP